MDVQEWKNVFYLYNRSTWPVISAVLQIYTEWVLFKFTCFYKYLIFICGYSMMQIYRFIYIYIHIPDINMSQHIVTYIYIYPITTPPDPSLRSRDRVSGPWMLWDKWKFVMCGHLMTWPSDVSLNQPVADGSDGKNGKEQKLLKTKTK